MLNTADLVRDGKLVAAAIDAVQIQPAALLAALPAPASPDQGAVLAILAGTLHLQAATPVLLGLLARDGLAGRAVAWALGAVPTTAAEAATTEAALLAAIAGGSIDIRDNAYHALAVLTARGLASATLAQSMIERVQAEIDRAKAGGSGLGEQVCRVLSVLGSPQLPELIQRVIEQDRYCDRFELQRLRKAVEDGGQDRSAVKALSAPWRVVFADSLVAEPAAAPAAAPGKPAPAPGAKAAPQQSAKPLVGHASGPSQIPPAAAGHPGPEDAEAEAGASAEDQDGGPPPSILPIEWKAFAASPEAHALPAPVQQMASQLGPLLEQLAARAVRAALADLNGQEFVALLLQVLPQALPPQHVQMALSPPAINAYQAIVKYLVRTGQATNGPELIDAVKMVRTELTNQIRQSGILGGPDYRDPDDKPPVKA